MTNSYDNQMLYAYLLGSLPSEDTERLDEMTFTDPDFADQVDAAEKDLVDSYVNGELSGDMLGRFESYYLSSPNRQRNVLFARTLQDFTARETSGSAAVAAPGSEKAGVLSGIFELLGAFFGGRPALALGAAVLIVALVGIAGWLMMRGANDRNGPIVAVSNENSINPVNTVIPPVHPSPVPTENRTTGNASNPKSETNVNSPSPTPTPKKAAEEPRPQVVVITLLPPLRGGEKLPQLRINPETSAASFTLNLESGDYSSYGISLVDQSSGKHILQTSSVKPRGNGTPSLSIKVPAKLLDSHVYSFAVSGTKKDGTSENIGDYPFRVVR